MRIEVTAKVIVHINEDGAWRGITPGRALKVTPGRCKGMAERIVQNALSPGLGGCHTEAVIVKAVEVSGETILHH